MVMNQRARDEYRQAVDFRDMAAGHVADGEINQAIVCNGLASVSIEIARFAVENHALVAGIDEDVEIAIAPPTAKPQGVWGSAP